MGKKEQGDQRWLWLGRKMVWFADECGRSESHSYSDMQSHLFALADFMINVVLTILVWTESINDYEKWSNHSP